MNVSGAAATSGAAFSAVAAGASAQSQTRTAMAAEVRAAKMTQDVSKMAGDVIQGTLDAMAKMQASQGVNVLV